MTNEQRASAREFCNDGVQAAGYLLLSLDALDEKDKRIAELQWQLEVDCVECNEIERIAQLTSQLAEKDARIEHLEDKMGVGEMTDEKPQTASDSIVDIGKVNHQVVGEILSAWRRADGVDPTEIRSIGWDRKLATVRDEAGFHWRCGLFFKRLTSGVVRITHFYSWNYCPNYECWDIPSDEWASIISGVSVAGETAQQYQLAKDFHSSVSHQIIPEALAEKDRRMLDMGDTITTLMAEFTAKGEKNKDDQWHIERLLKEINGFRLEAAQKDERIAELKKRVGNAFIRGSESVLVEKDRARIQPRASS